MGWWSYSPGCCYSEQGLRSLRHGMGMRRKGECNVRELGSILFTEKRER